MFFQNLLTPAFLQADDAGEHPERPVPDISLRQLREHSRGARHPPPRHGAPHRPEAHSDLWLRLPLLRGQVGGAEARSKSEDEAEDFEDVVERDAGAS